MNVIAYFDDLEGKFCLKINTLSHRESIRRLFAIVSKAGDGGFWFAMGLLFLSVEGADGLPALLHMSITAAVGILLYKILKSQLVRERPFMSHKDVVCGTVPLDRHSFLSGHTLHATLCATMLTFYIPALAWIVVPFAVLVAASRLILGLHYPSDVIVGALIGAFLAIVSISI